MADAHRGHDAHDVDAPEYLVGHLQDGLAADPRVNELGVHVTVRGSRIYLTGTVSTDERRAGAGAVAAELAPDYEIHNETAVEPCLEGEGAEATETLS